MSRIHLSVPHVDGAERELVAEAFDTNWLSTVGPHVDAFERELGVRFGRHAVALSSGTAAIHLGLRLLGVGPGDEVLCPTLTFVATANPVAYLGARPVFVDSERRTWGMDADLLEEALAARARSGRPPRAAIVVHLFGQCAEMDRVRAACDRHGVPLLEDAAEAAGATYRGRPAGGLGEVGVLSFNGNKIITTTGGGALLATDAAAAARVRHWAHQAREPGLAYHHVEVGYNYRLSNVLAAIGRGQLRVLDDRVRRRRAIAFRYRDAFADLGALELMPQAEHGTPTNWLSCFLVDEPALRDALIEALQREDVESRPLWKPMHLQPLYAAADRVGGAVAEDLFARGICLPSSSSLATSDQDRVVDVVRRTVLARRPAVA